ncbi:MAG: 16S rRNA (cytidine(1402)-2'-O)-methyltransferase [Deltaproteobacteria bacterium]|nr:16S rRNA (cytidine(1402)-2'-O)-methyltransferase [Deltaproteobacteria bacterium]
MNDNEKMGTLYIVATPIGNLEDITFRAVRILKDVSLIAAEDTRHTKKLLHAYGIQTPVTSLFDHNEAAKSGYLMKKMAEGCDIAYVSDAGTPGVSDPGYILVREAVAQNIRVVPIPGASAAIAALCASGLPMDSFVFNGFLPQKPDKRRAALKNHLSELRTAIFYESPKRLQSALQDVSDVMGNRHVVVARELTKVFEEIIRGPVDDVMAALSGRVMKGEVTLMIAGSPKTSVPVAKQDIRLRIAELKKRGDLSARDMAALISEELGISRRDVYQQIVETGQ